MPFWAILAAGWEPLPLPWPRAGAVPEPGGGAEVSEPDRPPRTLLRTLTALTMVSGLVDAVSYLGLGRVFTANMTGNVVVLGFAAAGAPGFSFLANFLSLGAFLVGAVVA